MSNRTLSEFIFSPKSIALIGASSDSKKNTSRPQRFLRKYGYPGQVFPINPGYDEIFGEKAFPDVGSVPGEVEHAFIMVPAHKVKAALEQCVAKKIPVVTIYSDGFAETGEDGRRAQEELLRIARAGGIRLIGPNCIGFFSSQTHLALSVNTFLEMAEVRPGSLALVSHSGSMTGCLLSRGLARGVGFSKLMSVGNEADMGIGEFADMLVDDPHTSAILLYMETIRDAEHLARAARRARAIGKPIIVYMTGRSAAGQELAASHTGAMIGFDERADAFFRAYGILRVDMLETLFELPALIAKEKPRLRHRVSVITPTGGGAACVVDRLGTYGVELVPPTETIITNLAQKNIKIGRARVIDLTLAGANKETYSEVLNELLASDHCDMVLAIMGAAAEFQPEITVSPLIDVDKHNKAFAVFLASHADKSLRFLGDAGIAGFRTPESCADAIRAWCDWKPLLDPVPFHQKELDGVRRLLASMGREINEYEASRIFSELGLPQVAAVVMATPGHEVKIDYPVVAKILSPDIAHKTDAGGVVVNLADATALKAAAKDITERVHAKHPKARLNGILVQCMEKGLAEVILGFKRDPQVGPVIVLGIGGLLAEVYHDFAVRMAPVSIDDAFHMVHEVKGLAPIRGYRDLPKGDCEALAKSISAFSQLAGLEMIDQAEINPLIVKSEGKGVVSVDGLIVRCVDQQ